MIRRIVVAIDVSMDSVAALQAAAQLAAGLRVTLHGLFVQDTDLISAADVPFVKEVRPLTVSTVELSGAMLRRQIDVQAVHARRLLEWAANMAGVPFEFSIRSGNVARELINAATETDLILLGKASLGASSRRKLGTTARTVLCESSAPVMVFREGLHLGWPIMVLYDGSPSAERALLTAVELARWRQVGYLFVMVWAREPEEQREIQHRLTETYSSHVPGLHFRPLAKLDIQSVDAASREEEAGIIIVPGDSRILDGAGLQEFLYAVDQPVMLVRDSRCAP
jgi:nucleotide-binding universal stress UspA family protein